MTKRCKFCEKPTIGWDLCYSCYELKKAGKLVLTRERKWVRVLPGQTVEPDMIYELRDTLITDAESKYYSELISIIPDNYHLFPQVALSSLVQRPDTIYSGEHRSELYRVLDFVITDYKFKPLIAIEINDSTHDSNARRQRDMTLRLICEEAGLPIFFVSLEYGIKPNDRAKIMNILYDSFTVARKPYIHKVIGIPFDSKNKLSDPCEDNEISHSLSHENVSELHRKPIISKLKSCCKTHVKEKWRIMGYIFAISIFFFWFDMVVEGGILLLIALVIFMFL